MPPTLRSPGRTVAGFAALCILAACTDEIRVSPRSASVREATQQAVGADLGGLAEARAIYHLSIVVPYFAGFFIALALVQRWRPELEPAAVE